MTAVKKVSYQKEYYHLFMGLMSVLLGSLMITHAIEWETFGIWFPFTMVLLGLLLVSSGGFATIMGLMLLLGGCTILLHQLGIVAMPYLKEVVGWFLIGVGILLILSASLKVWRKWSGKDTGDDPYGDPDVDY